MGFAKRRENVLALHEPAAAIESGQLKVEGRRRLKTNPVIAVFRKQISPSFVDSGGNAMSFANGRAGRGATARVLRRPTFDVFLGNVKDDLPGPIHDFLAVDLHVFFLRW